MLMQCLRLANMGRKAGVKKLDNCVACGAPLLGRRMAYCNTQCKRNHYRGSVNPHPQWRTKDGLHRRKIQTGNPDSLVVTLPKECATHLHAFYGDYVSFENVAGGVMIRRVVE